MWVTNRHLATDSTQRYCPEPRGHASGRSADRGATEAHPLSRCARLVRQVVPTGTGPVPSSGTTHDRRADRARRRVVKLPLPPAPDQLQFPTEHLRVVTTDAVVWRVHRTSGEHVVPWHQLRYWGAASTMRFDPHEPPPHVQDRGVSYAALDVPTALAEVFQRSRVINTRRGTPYLTAWSPLRPLTMLDLTCTWPIRAGASHAVNTGRRDHCRAWARAIHAARPDLDGLWHRSSVTGREAVTLFAHAGDSFPERPLMSLPLDRPACCPSVLPSHDRFSGGPVGRLRLAAGAATDSRSVRGDERCHFGREPPLVAVRSWRPPAVRGHERLDYPRLGKRF